MIKHEAMKYLPSWMPRRTDLGCGAGYIQQVAFQFRQGIAVRKPPAVRLARAERAGMPRACGAGARAVAFDHGEVAVPVAQGALHVLLLAVSHAHLIRHAPRPQDACR